MILKTKLEVSLQRAAPIRQKVQMPHKDGLEGNVLSGLGVRATVCEMQNILARHDCSDRC